MSAQSPKLLVVQCDDESPLGALESAMVRAGAELEIWRPPSDGDPPPVDGCDGIVVLGGRADPREGWLDGARAVLTDALREERPVLGVCLGAQLLAQAAGGTAEPTAAEIGWYPVRRHEASATDALFNDLADGRKVFEWHSASATPPPDAEILATTDDAVQAFRIGDRAWGVQFHLEIEMSIASMWISKAADQVREAGGSPSALRRETATRIDDSVAWSKTIAARFVEVVACQSRSPIPSTTKA
jgi:GMP synthase-like glutamine amidotransferase